MSLFTIDEGKCKKDGICVAECPIGAIFDFTDRSKPPAPIEEFEYLCLNCGHCVTVCSQAALTHKSLSPDDCLPINPEMALNPEQTEHFLRSRRSIRKYKKKEVEKETFEEIIKLASYAPSGHNMQPVQWMVVAGKEKVKQITALVVAWMEGMLIDQPDLSKMLFFDEMVRCWNMDEDIISRDAPALILANGTAGDSFSDNASKIAMTYLDLAIPSFGLGSQWNGFIQMAIASYKPLQEALGLPESGTNYATILVGYPKYKYHRMPTRNEPRISWMN